MITSSSWFNSFNKEEIQKWMTKSLTYSFDQCLHPCVVGTLPINLITGGTKAEFVEIEPGERLQPIQDSFFVDNFQQMVTTQTTMERVDLSCEVETMHNLS